MNSFKSLSTTVTFMAASRALTLWACTPTRSVAQEKGAERLATVGKPKMLASAPGQPHGAGCGGCMDPARTAQAKGFRMEASARGGCAPTLASTAPGCAVTTPSSRACAVTGAGCCVN